MSATVRTVRLALIACAAFILFVEPAPADDFTDHKLIRTELRTQRELRAMLGIGATPWSCRVGVGVQEFSVTPAQLDAVVQSGIPFRVLADNVQRLIDEEREAMELARGAPGADWFAVYRTWPEVNAYIDDLVALRPDLVDKLTVGTTHQDRTIYGMRITAPGGGPKPAVLFNGCQHAREWIAVMVPMYIADRLVREYDTDPLIQSLLERLEIFIVPIVNPDGYEHTYGIGGNRMWRKNRRWNGGSSFGVDLNRNWDADWGGPHSTSTNPNSDVYIGPSVFSEPETQAMRDFILDRANIAAHIDFHSYGQLILHPLGFTNFPTPHFGTFDALGAAMSQAIFSVHGRNYPHGTPGQLLYFASGIFPDWGYLERGIIGYTIELRPASGNPGFLLPPDQIIPTSEESFPAAVTMAQWTYCLNRPADLNGDGDVDVLDLLELLGTWGPCSPPGNCAADLNGDGVVDVLDLLGLLSAWGPCTW